MTARRTEIPTGWIELTEFSDRLIRETDPTTARSVALRGDSCKRSGSVAPETIVDESALGIRGQLELVVERIFYIRCVTSD